MSQGKISPQAQELHGALTNWQQGVINNQKRKLIFIDAKYKSQGLHMRFS
jgi:hypothetical protein